VKIIFKSEAEEKKVREEKLPDKQKWR